MEDKPRIDAETFAALDAVGRVQAISDAYGRDALLLSSMQKTSSALMHMIHRTGGKIRVLFVDTGFHFIETLAVRDAFIEKYGLQIDTAYPKMTPKEQFVEFNTDLWRHPDGQKICCGLRKEEPFLEAARGTTAVMNGLMRAEGGKRKNISPVGEDQRLDCHMFHPIYDWTEAMVEEYNAKHNVPVNALHFNNFPSIGCTVCTTPVRPGEDKRAGRWRHLSGEDGTKPTYCNINFSDGGGI